MSDDVEAVPHHIAQIAALPVDTMGRWSRIVDECHRIGLEPVFHVDPSLASYGKLRGVRRLKKLKR